MDRKTDKGNRAGRGERIAKRLARAGLCSRREAERWIADGRVAIGGKTITSPAVNVTLSDRIIVDGRPLPAAEPTRLWRYHKPSGLVTTASDPEGRETVFEALPPGLPRVVAVGRLDINSEGLLLLTNDGELARRLELPATGWTRRYRARAHGRPDPAALERLAKGVTIDGTRYEPVLARLDRAEGANAWLTLALREGKNREVRRLLEHLGLRVNRLIRTAYGPFQLGNLQSGTVAEVSPTVLAEQLGTAPAKPAAQPTNKPGGRAKAKPKPKSKLKAKPGSKSGTKPRPGARPGVKPAGRPKRDAGRRR